MNNKRTLFVIAAVLLMAGCRQTNQTPLPNIVVIIIDDLGWRDLGFMGSEYYETPNIDQLATEGMTFTNAYSNAANCAPTRASLLSGQYTPRHGVYTVASSQRGKSAWRRLIPTENSEALPLDKITIAEALKGKGYRSASIGKWHVGYSPQQQGFDVGIDRGDLGYGRSHFNDEGMYLADQLTEEAVKFIRQNQQNLFFLYLAHHAVHTPIEAKPEITNRYSAKKGVGCHQNATYAAMIESVDESVAQIVAALRQQRILDRTMIIFLSDNGGYGPATCMVPLRGGKGMYYEGGIRIPMFVVWPGKIAANSKTDIPAMTTDLFPTILEASQVNVSEKMLLDGVSLIPLLQGSGQHSRDRLFWHFPAYLESYRNMKEVSRDTLFRTRPVSVIRKDEWKLMLFHEEWVLDGQDTSLTGSNALELYNLSDDLGEQDNRILKEPAIRDELLSDLLTWIEQMEAPIPSEPNSEFDDDFLP
jgi:arylsulfatase A-like enzyme